jgi:tRNA pseudouridine55 synthase
VRRRSRCEKQLIVRDLDGVLLLDKPVGLSSNDALIKAKRVLNAKKAGHTGTLDPFATGLLPLCFGEATKFSQDLLEADKTYETIVHLGQTTDTGDTEGEVIDTRDVNVTLEQIDAVLAQFRGPIAQVPPMYSALKRDGKPLYEYARAGITLEREARNVIIHKLELISYEAPFLKLSVTCSKGTTSACWARISASALGCGAHLNALRRTQVGALTTEHMITLDALVAHEAPLGCCRRSMRCCPASRRAAECRAGQALPQRPAPAAGQGAVDRCRRNRAGCASISTTNCWAPPSLANTAFCARTFNRI